MKKIILILLLFIVVLFGLFIIATIPFHEILITFGIGIVVGIILLHALHGTISVYKE